MPRRGSGGGGGGFRSGNRSRSSVPAARKTAARPAKPTSAPAPARAPAAQSSGGGLGSAVVDGMTWGIGSSFGHRIVDSIMGPRTIRHEAIESAAPPAPRTIRHEAKSLDHQGGSSSCDFQTKAFQDCLNSSGSDISRCQHYMDMLTECRRNSAINA